MGFEINGQKYIHERATSTQQTGFSFVAQCRSWLPAKVGGILWFGVDDTYSTVYCPMYCGITEIPECFKQGNGDMVTYSETAAFWLFNRVTNFVYSRYCDMIVDLQKVQNHLEETFIKEVARNDERAKTTVNNEEVLVKILNEFSVFHNVVSSRFHFLTHQHAESEVSIHCIFHCHLSQSSDFRIHGCFPKLIRVHFTKTFISLNVEISGVSPLFENFCHFIFCIGTRENC